MIEWLASDRVQGIALPLLFIMISIWVLIRRDRKIETQLQTLTQTEEPEPEEEEEEMASEEDYNFLTEEINTAKLIAKVETILHETLEIYFNPGTKTLSLCAKVEECEDQWYIISPLVAEDLVTGLVSGIRALKPGCHSHPLPIADAETVYEG